METKSSQPIGHSKASVNNEGALQTREAMLVNLFTQHYSSLVRLASFLLDDISVCEEIVQEAFVKMQVMEIAPEVGKEAAYLRSIVLNGARSKLRRRIVKRKFMAKERAILPTPSLESEIISATERRHIVDLLKKLPKRQAEVLMLRFYMDLSEDEIAQTLNISKGSVKTHASRGLDKMGEMLEGRREINK